MSPTLILLMRMTCLNLEVFGPLPNVEVPEPNDVNVPLYLSKDDLRQVYTIYQRASVIKVCQNTVNCLHHQE